MSTPFCLCYNFLSVSITDFKLNSCPKKYRVDQDKTIDPLSTVGKALAKLSGQCDLSNLQIKPRHDEVSGAYSFSSISDQLQASGKGLTPEQSQASAIMEFLERYSWLHFDYASYEGHTIKTFPEILASKTRTVDRSFFFNNFIGLYDQTELEKELPVLPIRWIKGLSLHNNEPFYYPLNWYNYIFTSNGLATGNAMEEAIIQALCEVIERENIYRLFGDRQVADDIEIASLTHPLIINVLTNAKKKGLKFIIKNISYDLGIPTILVFGVSPDDRYGLVYQGCGYGTHPDPEKAIIRALSEYFESYSLLKEKAVTVKNANWPDLLNRLPRRNFGFLAFYNAEMIMKRKRKVKLKELPNLSCDDIKDEILLFLAILKKHHYEAIFIDKTHPDLQIPVPRIFIPKMRNLVVSECFDPYFILSETFFEGKDLVKAQRFLKKSAQKISFHNPEAMSATDPQILFKEDYRQTLLSYGSFKKNAAEILAAYQK